MHAKSIRPTTNRLTPPPAIRWIDLANAPSPFGNISALSGFADAKFGIYLHWGPYSVAKHPCWFPRLMYVEGREEHEWFTHKFGDVSKFGYKDLIPLWKGEHFDPDRLVRLFKHTGAKYITPIAVHLRQFRSVGFAVSSLELHRDGAQKRHHRHVA